MNRKKANRKPRIIDVEPVEVESTALVVRRPAARALPRYSPAPVRSKPAKSVAARPPVDPTGRLDVLAYRLAAEYALPWAERVMNIPGLANVLEPWAEVAISEALPPMNIFKAAPKPRRRLK